MHWAEPDLKLLHSSTQKPKIFQNWSWWGNHWTFSLTHKMNKFLLGSGPSEKWFLPFQALTSFSTGNYSNTAVKKTQINHVWIKIHQSSYGTHPGCSEQTQKSEIFPLTLWPPMSSPSQETIQLITGWYRSPGHTVCIHPDKTKLHGKQREKKLFLEMPSAEEGEW